MIRNFLEKVSQVSCLLIFYISLQNIFFYKKNYNIEKLILTKDDPVKLSDCKFTLL